MRDRDTEFTGFFQAESEKLRRLAAFLTGDSSGAADLAQEALVRTYRHWGRIRNEDPGPYARRILVNLVRQQHRRTLLAKRYEQTQAPEHAVNGGRVEDWLRVTAALKQLPPARRAVVVLRFYEDMTEHDIATTLDRPLGTVKSDMHRGLAKLRQLLDDTEKETA
ncbi:MAG: SigE family RNA polymerase sigma factor [Actinomycetota bacterium]|nr:SigE family RNA polymerase sigma factor [Actinomycetota bacterium]